MESSELANLKAAINTGLEAGYKASSGYRVLMRNPVNDADPAIIAAQEAYRQLAAYLDDLESQRAALVAFARGVMHTAALRSESSQVNALYEIGLEARNILAELKPIEDLTPLTRGRKAAGMDNSELERMKLIEAENAILRGFLAEMIAHSDAIQTKATDLRISLMANDNAKQLFAARQLLDELQANKNAPTPLKE